MAFGPDNRFELRTGTMTGAQADAAQIDVGLREYMLRVYNYMALGVALTGIVSMLVAMSPAAMATIFNTPLKWGLFIGIIGFGFFAPRLMLMKSVGVAQISFWTYAAIWGALIAPFFYVYTQESIARVFFITAAMFAGTSLYGYTTKRDLTGVGRFLMMATIGILVAVVVNIFMQSTGLHLLLSVVVPLIFAGLTAYETQQIKNWYAQSDMGDVAAKKAIFGAFMLYGSFVTMFVWLMQLFGVARE